MPESTIAIVAAGAAELYEVAQYLFTPVTNGHFGVAAAESCTRASAVIASTCLSPASAKICAPVNCTATPSIELKVRVTLMDTPRTSATA